MVGHGRCGRSCAEVAGQLELNFLRCSMMAETHPLLLQPTLPPKCLLGLLFGSISLGTLLRSISSGTSSRRDTSSGAPLPGAPLPGAPLPGAPLPAAPLPGAPLRGHFFPGASSGTLLLGIRGTFSVALLRETFAGAHLRESSSGALFRVHFFGCTSSGALLRVHFFGYTSSGDICGCTS